MAENNINNASNVPVRGMNMNRLPSQIPQGSASYALNASIESFDGKSITYQNELGNELCLEFPDGYQLIGSHFIPEINKNIFFLASKDGDSEIGYMDNGNCNYITYINSPCLNFSINHPIHKVAHRKTNCSLEIYWTDAYNDRRFLDLENIPFKTTVGIDGCSIVSTQEIDCNKLSIQPSFSIPTIEIVGVVTGGSLTAGTVQFGIQYSDANGNGYTSFYSITNPVPIADTQITTADFNYNVGKSVALNISNLDVTGYYQYYNLAVIKTINNIPSVELIGTYFIDGTSKNFTYSGQNQTQIRLSMEDIFIKTPTYSKAEDLTVVQDVLVWKGLTSTERINYQSIANKIKLQWQTYRIPSSRDYSDGALAANYRGYLRDEVYPFEIVFILDGRETDGFHIPGREINGHDFSYPDVLPDNPDYIGEDEGPKPYWKIYNTAYSLGKVDNTDPDYEGPYEYGEFAYWESTETYPCNAEVWGELAGKPIRHHKFPDVLVSPIFESPTPSLDEEGRYILQSESRAIFPIGIRIDISQVRMLISQSSLTKEQKEAIIGFKIVRGNRDVNKSIVAKGILRNVGKYVVGEEPDSDPNTDTTTSTSSTSTSTSTTSTSSTTTTTTTVS